MKSVLLVHGAWHGSWCWEIVQNGLIENGVDTHSVNLPFTGVEDDISAVKEAIASIDNEIILLGHSYGGIVISKAAEDTEKVTQLIYLCAILLEPGETMQLDGSKIEIDVDDRDKLFREAAEVLVTAQQGSASLLQRKLKLGYNRAGRLIDQLEAAGIVGPFEGSKARQVLISDLQSLDQYLDNEQKNQ